MIFYDFFSHQDFVVRDVGAPMLINSTIGHSEVWCSPLTISAPCHNKRTPITTTRQSEVDYLSPETETYEIEVKDGNRIGRRLRRGLTSIAKNIGRSAKPGLITEPFDPNAYDGDGDGLIQDGTVWERPVVARAQSIPTPNAPLANQVGTDDSTTSQEVQKQTRRVINAAPNAQEPTSRTGGLRATTTRDITDPEWRETATPRELAESIVPDTVAKTDELAERINVPRANYKTEKSYQTALALHRDVVRRSRRVEIKQIQALVGAYDAKYGDGAYYRDLQNDTERWDKNLKEMFGDSREWGAWLGANATDGVYRAMVKKQMRFLRAYKNSPDSEPLIDDLIDELEQMIRSGNGITHGTFFNASMGQVTQSLISPVEYILARLFLEHGNDPQKSLLFPQLRSPADLLAMESTLDIAKDFLNNFSEFSATNGSRPFTIEQIAARLQFALDTDTRRGIYTAIFAGRSQDNLHLAKGMRYMPSEDPRDIEMLRALIQRTLEDNPEFLFAVRKFGHPVVTIPSPEYDHVGRPPELSQRLLTLRDTELTQAEKRNKLISGKHYEAGFLKGIQDQRNGDEASFGAAGLLGFQANLGGQYFPDYGAIMLTRTQMMAGILSPSEADQGILKITGTKAIDSVVGESGVLVHEYGHYVDFVLRNTLVGAIWERTRRRIDTEIQQMRADGTLSPGAQPPLAYMERKVKEFRDELATMPGLGELDNKGKQKLIEMADRQNRQRLFIEMDEGTKQRRYGAGEVPTGTHSVDVRGLDDDELDGLIDELEGQLSEVHGDTDLMNQRLTEQKLWARGQQAPRGSRATDVGENSVGSAEPYVVTPYGNQNTTERFAESGAAILTRIGQRYPILVNNAAVRMWSRILGVNIEAQDVTRLSRRKKNRQGDFTDQMEDISDRIISDIKIVAPNVERQPDGHRPGMASSTSSERLRFDPDERSMLRSRSNIGLDTDERLYATNDPISIMDFASRPRVYSIGDHHFYDTEVPFATGLYFALRRRLGEQAGRRFINRNRPHHGDLVRAISATQFGFFIDDLPTYDTTTTGQMAMLRGFVTGKIAKLDFPQRNAIEEALRDATRIHSAVQGAELSKRELYRSVPIDTETVLESISIGDNIPMPITAFSPDKPSNKDKSVIIRLERGAKAISTGDNQMLTQGNFEVVNFDVDGAQMVVTLRHTETFDPRHDALRPVDKFAHKPNKMRKMGSWMPRYTPEEQQKMETDLQRRKDRNEAFGLRSTTSRSDTDLTDEEIDDFITTEAEQASSERAERARGSVVNKAKAVLRDYVSTSVAKRLSKARDSIIGKHGSDTPWKRDADAIRKWRSIDRDTQKRAAKTLRAVILATLDEEGDYGAPNAGFYNTETGRFIKGVASPERLERLTDEFTAYAKDSEGIDLSSSQIRHLLKTGELVLWRRGSDNRPTERTVLVIPSLLQDGTQNDTGVGPSPKSVKELQEVLKANLAVLEATERAYLMDGSLYKVAPGDRGVFEDQGISGRIMNGDTELIVAPNGKGVYVSLDNGRGISVKVDASFGTGRQRYYGGTGFTREIYVAPDGNINVHHDRFWISASQNERKKMKSAGIGTLFNQHAFQWWRQHEGTEVWIPNPTSDGVMVWPRSGFGTPQISTQIGNQRKLARDAQARFTDFVRSVVLRGLGKEDKAPSTRTNPLVNENLDYGLRDNPEMLRRVVAWLAVARQAEKDGTTNNDLQTLLANIIEPRNLTSEQKEAWRELFENAQAMGGLSMFLDDEKRDDDYLPSFVIPEPTEGMDATEIQKRIEKTELLQRDLSNSNEPNEVARDLFMPEDDDEPGNRALSEKQAGRLYGIVSSRNEREVLMQARENSGASAPPRLLTRVEMKDRVDAGQIPVYGFIPVENGDIFGIKTDQEIQAEEVHSAIVGMLGSDILMRFTDAPYAHLDKFYDSKNPISDPATTKNGMLGFLAPWARVYTPDKTSRGERKLYDDIWSLGAKPGRMSEWRRSRRDGEPDYDGLMDTLVQLYGYEYDASVRPYGFRSTDPSVPSIKMKLIRSDENSFGGTSDSEQQKSIRRLIGALFSIENNRRLELNEDTRRPGSSMLGKTQDLRDGLLEAMANPDSTALLALLGYDAIESRDGTITVINNGAMQLMDEPVSFAEAVRMVDAPRFRELPTGRVVQRDYQYNGLLRRLTNNPDWFTEDEPRLFSGDSPIVTTRNGIRSSTYIRAVRQDHNINLETPLRKKRGLSSNTKRRMKERELRREPLREGWIDEDDKGFVDYVAGLEARFNALQAELEQWDEENDGDAPIDWNKREEIKQRMDEVSDEFASLISTSNLVMETALEHQAAINAISAILNERDGILLDGRPKVKDIPDEMVARLKALRQQLITEQANKPSVLDLSRARRRHKAIKDAMENFDLQFEVRWFPDEQIDLELNEVKKVDLADREESLTEHFYRGLFDPQYDAWFRRYNVIRDGRFVIQGPDDEIEQRLRDMFADITPEQRAEWARAQSDFMDEEYNMEYEEDLIDANPVSGSTRPRDVPAPTWRKIRAAMSRARSTQFEGEKEAARQAAVRLLRPHRPDLANDEFIGGIRSTTSLDIPRSRINIGGRPTRGSRPDEPTTNYSNHPIAVIAEKVRAQGFDVDEIDLLPTGRIGSRLRKYLSSDYDPSTDAMEDPELLAVMEATVAEARKTTGVIPVEGHIIKKVLGPVDEQVADLLGDDVDIAMLRAHGAPTYDQIIDAAAYRLIELERLNRMFGSYEENGKIIGGSLSGSNAYKDALFEPARKKGKSRIFVDIRGNELARVTISEKQLEEIMENLDENTRRVDTIDAMLEVGGSKKLNTNDLIFGAMAEAVGLKEKYPDINYTSASLNDMRKELDGLTELYGYISFAPTPAGDHLRRMFQARLEMKSKNLELMENFGKRYVHLLRSRGLNDSQIAEMLRTLLREVDRNPSRRRALTTPREKEAFYNGMPGTPFSTKPALRQALETFLGQQAGSALVPKINDGDIEDIGLHEIGHFTLGQAFTRHGEFVANAWPMFLYGDGYWGVFAEVQKQQSELFDNFTVKEHFGRVVTPELKDALEGIGPDAFNVRRFLGIEIVGMSKGKHVNLTEADKNKINDDIIERVKARTDISESQKKIIIDAVMNDAYWFREPGSSSPGSGIPDFVVKRAEEAGIDIEILKGHNWKFVPERIYDPMVPLPSHLFGWKRMDGSAAAPPKTGLGSSTTRRRQEFASMLRTLNVLIGQRPGLLGNETYEEMARIDRSHKQKRQLAKRRLSPIIDALRQMASKYPELAKDFASELKDLRQ